VNLDFDSGGVTTPGPFKGFDAPDAPEIEGWTNYRNGAAGPLNDAGVEAAGVGWWVGDGPHQNAGFMSSGDAAYTMSTYTIQSGDVFNISYIGGEWSWTGDKGEWTATSFYDDPANVIGSYIQGMSSWFPDGVWYSSTTGIAATPESVGGTLGILFTNTGTRIVQFDEATLLSFPNRLRWFCWVWVLWFCVARNKPLTFSLFQTRTKSPVIWRGFSFLLLYSKSTKSALVQDAHRPQKVILSCNFPS
jgi:hypothetical protein